MKKKVISLLLAVVLLLGIPLSVSAALIPEESHDYNTVTGREIGPAGSEDVAVVVYGNTMTDLVMSHTGGFDAFLQALQAETQDLLANEEVPHVEMYLVNDKNQEYKLTENAVYDAALLSSFNYTANGILGFSETIFKWLQGAFGWAVQNIDGLQSLYRIYGATNVPEGTYTLEVRSLDKDGYTLCAPSSGTVTVKVTDDARGTSYVGYEEPLGSVELKKTVDLYFWEFDVNLITATFTMPGVFLDARDPGFTFTSADFGGNAVPDSEFLLVNRDETEKIIKAAYALGKDTFNNAMDLVGTEGYTWEELSILHNEVLTWDEDNQQISIDGKNAYKLLGTYWSLVQASATDPLITFMSDETDIRLPAILQATADENGKVFFGPKNNVTLVWSLEILLKMGNIVLEKADEMDLVDDVFPDPTTNAIVNLVIDVAKNALKSGTPLWDENGNLNAENINNWVYPILMNDNIMEFASDTLHWFAEDELTEEEQKLLKLLPTHAILTKKMPAGKYIMLETAVPDGFIHSPLFYTIDMTWEAEGKIPADWCYVSVANLGIVTPYYAEEFYTWLRDFDYKTEADTVLNKITDGKAGTLFSDTLNGNNDLSALSIAFYADTIYNYLGGNMLYSSQKDLAEALSKYLYAHGRTAQNLLIFGDQVAQKSKAVVTGEITSDWTYYNFTTSARTNSALKLQAILWGIEKSIDTSDDNVATAKAKEAVGKIAEKIDTSNRIIKQTTKVQNAVKDFLRKTASSIGQKVTDKAFSLVKTVLGWAKQA